MGIFVIMNHQKEILDRKHTFNKKGKPIFFETKAKARTFAKGLPLEKSTGLLNYKIKRYKGALS